MVQAEKLCRLIVHLFSYVCILGIIYIVKLCAGSEQKITQSFSILFS